MAWPPCLQSQTLARIWQLTSFCKKSLDVHRKSCTSYVRAVELKNCCIQSEKAFSLSLQQEKPWSSPEKEKVGTSVRIDGWHSDRSIGKRARSITWKRKWPCQIVHSRQALSLFSWLSGQTNWRVPVWVDSPHANLGTDLWSLLSRFFFKRNVD